ncbi:hypothetical protein M9434_000709 [Picochlorum sp. BPE23]|nr:hypothetical protein M9434_000709 [Picochlorum sp. BPE23]
MGVIIEEIFDDSSVEEEQPRGGNGNGNEHDTCREKGTTSRIVEAYEQGSDSVSPTTTTDTAAAEEEDWVEVEEPSFDDEEGAAGINSGTRVQEDQEEEEELRNPYIHFNQGEEGVEEVISEEERKRRMEEAEVYREEGNRLFKEQNYIEALELYTKALEVAPVEPRKKPSVAANNATDNKEEEGESTESHQDHRQKRSVYFANRAACQIALRDYESAANDCSDAIDLDPSYLKAYMRRAMAFEHMEEYDRGLQDAKHILDSIDPSNAFARAYVTRVTPLAEKKQEQLKEEMMSKLKDLGNSLLGNFGLSLDNFKAEQDPETGSYSVKFSQ